MNTSSDLPIRPFGRALVGAPTGTESAEFDRFAIDDLGVPQPTLMENAGRSAAMVLQRLFPRGQVTALVGTGNNGGDALVLLRNLAAWGRPVTAILVGEREEEEALLHGWGIRTLGDVDLMGDASRLDGEQCGGVADDFIENDHVPVIGGIVPKIFHQGQQPVSVR